MTGNVVVSDMPACSTIEFLPVLSEAICTNQSVPGNVLNWGK